MGSQRDLVLESVGVISETEGGVPAAPAPVPDHAERAVVPASTPLPAAQVPAAGALLDLTEVVVFWALAQATVGEQHVRSR